MTRMRRSGEKRQHERTWQGWCRWGNSESLLKRKNEKKREKKYGLERHCWLLCLPLFRTHGGGQLLGTPLLVSNFSSTDWTHTHTHKHTHTNWLKLNFFSLLTRAFRWFTFIPRRLVQHPDQKPSLCSKNVMVWRHGFHPKSLRLDPHIYELGPHNVIFKKKKKNLRSTNPTLAQSQTCLTTNIFAAVRHPVMFMHTHSYTPAAVCIWSGVGVCVKPTHEWIIFRSYRDLSGYHPTPSTH